jgi:hypothetical protein
MDRKLLEVARNSIKKSLGLSFKDVVVKKEWQENRATFVTLTINKNLRGCIGSIEARQSIYEDIRHNAYSAAFNDPRFPPVTSDELDNIKIEISILTPLKEIIYNTEEDILKSIIPFKMGLLLEHGFYRGTFLPQVWEHFNEPKDFFNHLKQKAGLSIDFFDPQMKLYYYEVEKCQE